MVIANPIYDVVFKRIMENERVAKFFIGTLLDQNIETIEVKPQEYTYEGEFDFNNPKDVAKYEARIRERHSIWVYRLDFIATIKTETGELKKVLIEIQKAKNQVDLMRFRNYLAEQYKKEDTVNNKKVVLPITTIYILGFKLPEIETPCLKVERNYLDLTNKTTLITKSDFVEKLTHDSFIVQVERITNKYQSKLDKLLSIFEQNNFVDDNTIVKEFKHELDIEELKIATDILHHSGTNPQEKKKIENEQEAIRTINALFEDEIWFFEQEKKQFEAAKKQFEKTVSENQQTISENQQTITEKDLALAKLQKEIEELKNKLGNK
ncbi:MAG: hypothetical protein EAY66_06585 [Sphingobacteriales bacterium]|jgi:hypothetical protein|nr:MAG: hypothetical protein EAY66_06585 [Sphingobacteriales bacterium]